MRHRTPQFGHVFAGDGYSAGYYSYLWADSSPRRLRTRSPRRAPTTSRGRAAKNVLRVATVDPADGYRAFRGGRGIAALMRKRGFPVPAVLAVPR